MFGQSITFSSYNVDQSRGIVSR